MAARLVSSKSDEVGLGGLLESANSGRLESQVGLEVLGDLTNETLEGSFRMRSSVDFW